MINPCIRAPVRPELLRFALGSGRITLWRLGQAIAALRMNLCIRSLTLSFSFLPINHASSVRKRISSLKEYVSLSSDWICYALM